LTELKPALLWDMDGTLFDSRESHFKSWQLALNNHGHYLDREVFNANFGRNNTSSLSLFLGFQPESDYAESILEEKEAIFRQIAPVESCLVKGVECWLSTAKARAYPQAVASSAPMKNIESLLQSFNLIHYFDVLISGAKLPAKPEPDVFLVAARRLHQKPESCWVIEDSPAGVKAAKNAGMRCIAVTTSNNPSDLSLADVIIEDFSLPIEKILKISRNL